MILPDKVKIVEVGARDGLQNESVALNVTDRVKLIDHLSASGLPVIEVGSFVSPHNVPQMSGTDQVFSSIERYPSVIYSALVPNMKGLSYALNAGFEEIAFFVAASESFSRHNINCSIEQSLEHLAEIATQAFSAGLSIRGYVSCVAGCPYEGDVPVEKVAEVAARLVGEGCYEVSLGDTLGIGTPMQIQEIITGVTKLVPRKQLAVHFHDTFGMALANILVALQEGINIVDSSIAGLGGCPYAPGASGNVATEDVVYMMSGLGIETGVNLESLLEAGDFVCRLLGRPSGSKVAKVYSTRNKMLLNT